MTLLYLDTFSGISGDMMLGLLVDLGVDLQDIQNALAHLPISGYKLTARPAQRHGIGGTQVCVEFDSRQPTRTWADIDKMLEQSNLQPASKQLARRIFHRLGEAEASVHRVPLEQVHFHEVGAIDAIVDIVGTAYGLSQLEISRIVCSPLPLSNGLIKSHHGVLPLPAPATLQILRDAPVKDAGSDKELVTPTGAAIAASIAEFGPMPELTPQKIGYGVGGWDLDDRPNLLRGILAESETASGLETDEVVIVETHLDDTPAEWLGSLMDRLMAYGALDVTFSPLQMKKNRPGTKLTVIAQPVDGERLARLVLRESSALGVRMHRARRLKLRRESRVMDTTFGPVELKLAFEGDQLLRVTPEYESCRVIAEQTGRVLPDVYRLVMAEASRHFGLES